MESKSPLTYRNAMEFLVIEEVNKQFATLPPKLAQYLNQEEVIAYALNRLPTLYATSEQGWQQQCLRGKEKYAAQIKMAVRQGLAAVHKDPLRVEVPLTSIDAKTAQATLQKINLLLKRQDVTWNNVVEAVEAALAKLPTQVQMWKRFRHQLRDYRR